MGHPVRKSLPHVVPSWIRPDEAVYFITICCDPRGRNQLCYTKIANALFESVAFRNQRNEWWTCLFLLMPDHLHMLVSFPPSKDMQSVVSLWKHYGSAKLRIVWQRDFFDHRLRSEESFGDKANYILQNPVRQGLSAIAEDWPYVWWPEMPDGRRGAPSLPSRG